MAKANLILTVTEITEDKTIIDEMMLAAEQYINELGFFTMPVNEVEAKLRAELKGELYKHRKEIEQANAETATKIGIRIHIQEGKRIR